ncbi:MAG: translation initiation factor IF-2 [Candidatus Altiarchaeota archaeon]
MSSPKTREPIIVVLGHVDHGKTTFLDYIRGSVIASREAGGITQHIGATDVPFEVIKDVCKGLLSESQLKVPLRGLLFIDTPGHEAFTNLRQRGGSVADLAVLVVDISDGLMPQSREAISILKQYKVPFIILANKVDSLSGWIKDTPLEKQPQFVHEEFEKKYYNLIVELSEEGFDGDLFNNVRDFTKRLAIVPVSAKTGQGVPEALTLLVGLSQAFLTKRLTVAPNSPGKGTILEVKEEIGLGKTIDTIIYDGVIRKGDSIVVGAQIPIVTKVKALLRPKPLDEMRDPKEKFLNVKEVYAASGIKIVAPCLDTALAGAPVYVGGAELVEKVLEEIGSVEFESDKLGVVVKADTLGSLEALVKMLADKDIPIRKGTIGKVGKNDIITASAVSKENRFLGVILAFNSQILPEAEKTAEDLGLKILSAKVIYQLLDDYELWVKEEKESEKLASAKEHTPPAKVKLVPGCIFRQCKPAIVGVEVLAGTLRVGSRLMREDNSIVGRVKSMQCDKESIKDAACGSNCALAIDGAVMGRNLYPEDVLYAFLTNDDIAALDLESLSEDERLVLKEFRAIRKKRNE